MRAGRCLAVAALLMGASGDLRAQERAVFLVRRGVDTIAVERMSRDAARATGSLLVRAPFMRLDQELALARDGTVERDLVTVRSGAHADSVLQRAELTLLGDSAAVHVENPRVPGADRRARAAAGAIPYANPSGLSLETIIRRARVIGGDSVRVSVLSIAGQVVVATVRRAGADSVLLELGGVAVHVRTDSVGRLLGAAIPAQDVVIERLAPDSPVGAWSPAPPADVYAPPAGAPYAAEEVHVRTPAGLTLAGTLTIPAHSPRVRLPAVVLITGSGPQDRDEAFPAIAKDLRPFREIADTLSRRGIAVLRLDDRGVGGSDVGPPDPTTADLANDVRAAVAWLRTRAEIDPARIGLVGHSEGGVIAPMVAADDKRLRGIVLIAGTASNGRVISAQQLHYVIERDTSLAPRVRDSLLALGAHQADSAFATTAWLRFWGRYDPLRTARRVRAPTLILQGETDRQVPVAEARLLADAMRTAGNRRVTLRTFPNMDHLMLDDPSGDFRAYASLPSHRVRKDLLGTLADWLAAAL